MAMPVRSRGRGGSRETGEQEQLMRVADRWPKALLSVQTIEDQIRDEHDACGIDEWLRIDAKPGRLLAK
jgi:hypothetical protein